MPKKEEDFRMKKIGIIAACTVLILSLTKGALNVKLRDKKNKKGSG